MFRPNISAQITQKPDGLPPVYIVNHDHLGVILWGENSITWALDMEYNRLKKYKNFTTGWDNEAYSYDYLSVNSPQVLKKMQDGFNQYRHRISMGTSTYGQPLTRFINEESNIRQLTIGAETIEKHFNYTPKVYCMGEHAFHAQTPQILRGAGFESAIMRSHFMMFGYNPTISAPVVLWRGMDGTTIPTVPTYKGQEHFAVASSPAPFGSVTLDGVILTDFVRRKGATLHAFREEFGKTIRPLVASRADDPRQPDEIIEAHEDDPYYKWTVNDSLFKFLPYPNTLFSPKPKDFGERMPWGYCGNWMWNRSRKAEVSVLNAERLAAISHNLGGFSREEELKKAWKNLLVAQHHDIQIVGIEKAGEVFLNATLSQSQAIADEAFTNIAKKIGTSAQERYVVFNPLNWQRRDIPQNTEGGILSDVKPLGFKSESVNPIRFDTTFFIWISNEKRLNTPFYKIQFDATGGIIELKDAKTGRILNARNRKNGILAATINGKSEFSETTAFNTEGGTFSYKIIEKGMIGTIPFEAVWIFYSFSPRVDYHLDINVKDEKIGHLTTFKRPDPYSAFENDEKLRFKFYPDLGDKTIGVEDQPFIITETNERNLQGNYWIALSDGTNGLAYFNKGTMCSFRENDGSLSVPLAFSTTFIWNTVPMKGKYSYDLSIYPFSGNWRDADLHRKALEYNFPLIAFRIKDLDKNPLGNEWSPYREAKDEGAILSALYTEGGKTFARFYEYQGKNASVSFKWLNQNSNFEETDMRNRPLAQVGNTCILTPHKITTLKILNPTPERDYAKMLIPTKLNFKYENDWTQSKWLKKDGVTMEELLKCVIK
jgi:hypothetical protein